MHQQILIDPKLNNQLATDGYVVVDFIKQNEVELILEFYNKNPPNSVGGFHTTHFSLDTIYKRKVQQFIIETLSKNIVDYFSFHYPIFANFMIKYIGGNNPMPLHADWTYVDENYNSSYALWIPLVDTNIENGCIGVIPFSHQISDPIRGPRISQWDAPTGENLIKDRGLLLPLKVGKALIYNHKTLHYSLPNNSSFIRPAINISLVPKGSNIIHYSIPEGEEKLFRYEVENENFFIEYNSFQMPQVAVLKKEIWNVTPQLLEKKLDTFLSAIYR